MRIVTVFPILVIIAAVSVPGHCQEVSPAMDRRHYIFTMAPQFGMIYGQALEVVYPPGGYKGEFLSQLLWDMKPLFYGGLALDFARREPMAGIGFFSGISFKMGLPGVTGKMEDRDWQSSTGDLTDYSIHDNTVGEFFWVEGTLGASFPLFSLFLLKAYASALYTHFSFSANDGYGTYNWNNWKRLSFSGAVINYTQEWFIIAPGISVDFHFLEHFFVDLSFRMSPFIWCSDLDEHLTTRTQFRDEMRRGLFLEPGIQLGFSANRWFELCLEMSYRSIKGTRGEAYYRQMGTDAYAQAGEAGAGLSIMDAGIVLKIHL